MRPSRDRRLIFVDLLYGFGIFLVLLGHSLAPQWDDRSHPFQNALDEWIYSFHMPLFFFLSGVVFRHAEQGVPFKRFLRKRIGRLLTPYICVNLLYALQKALFARFAANPAPFSKYDLAAILVYPDRSFNIILWFLPTLFFANMLVFFLGPQRFKSRIMQFLVLTLFVLGSALNPVADVRVFAIGRVVTYAVFSWIGALCYEYRGELGRCSIRWKLIIAGVLFAAHGAALSFNAPHLSSALLGISACSFLAVAVSESCPQSADRLLAPLHRNSYQIYLLSGLGHAPARVVLTEIWAVPIGVATVSIFVAGLSFSLVVVATVKMFARPLAPCIGMRVGRPVLA